MRFIHPLVIATLLITSWFRGSKEEPAPFRNREGIEVVSGKNEILLSCEWKEDTETKIVCLLTPPLVNLRPEIEEFTLRIDSREKERTEQINRSEAEKRYGEPLIRELEKSVTIAPEGFLRFNYFQSVRIDPRISASSVITRTSLQGPTAIPPPELNLAAMEIRLAFENGNEYPRPDASRLAPGRLAKAWGKGKKTGRETGGFPRILEILMDNPEMALEYATKIPPLKRKPESGEFRENSPSNHPGPGTLPLSELVLQLGIREEGLYKIDRELIGKGGFEPDKVNPRHFHLSCRGKEIPTATWGCFAKSFTENDALVFYGTPPETPYTDLNIYRLFYDEKREGLRMEVTGEDEPSGDQTDQPGHFINRYRLEKDFSLKIHSGNFLSIKGMRWVWEDLKTGAPFLCVFDLPGFLPLVGEGELRLKIYCHPGQWNSLNSRIEMILNDEEPVFFTITNPDDDLKTLEIDYSILREKGNEMSLRMMPREDKPPGEEPTGVYIDYIELEHPRRFLFEQGHLHFQSPSRREGRNITYTLHGAPSNPILGIEHSEAANPRFIRTKRIGAAGMGRIRFTTREQGRESYLFSTIDRIPVPGDPPPRPVKRANLSNPENLADYLIISYPDFIPTLRPLADEREKQGMKTKIVDVEAIYDEFNHGLQSPLAIKEFLATALAGWELPPTYVLLVGDSSSDYRNEARNDVKNFVPAYSYSARVGEQDKWASDHWYTTLTGEDEYPDIILGRISVNSIEDTGNIVNKILHYGKNRTPGPWRATLGYVADDGPFDEEAEDLRKNHTPLSFTGKTIYLEDLPLEDNFYLDRAFVERSKAKVSTEATARIFDLFQNGAVFISFFGHGSPNIWTDERIWFGGDTKNSDNLHLTNFERLPFVTNMTCNSGAIDYPTPKWNVCISEDCMRQKNGGAIGLFVPSGPGFTSSHKKISKALREVLFQYRLHELGEAVTLAKCLYLVRKNSLEIMQMFIFLGDPALALQIPGEDIPLKPDHALFHPSELPASIRVEGVSNTLEEGKVLFSLYSPSNKPLLESEPVTFSDGKIASSFTIPEGAERGEWVVRAYLYNEKTGRDAVGSAAVTVGEPFLTLSNPRVEKALTSIPAGESVRVSLELTNDSPVPCPDAGVELRRPLDPAFPPESQIQSLDPGEKRTCSWEIITKRGLNILTFHNTGHSIHPDPTIPVKATETLAFTTVDDEASSPDLAVSPLLLERTYMQSGKNTRLSIRFPVYNKSRDTLNQATVRILKGTVEGGTPINTTRIKSLAPGVPRHVSLSLHIREPLEKQTYLVEVLPSKGGPDPDPSDNRFRFTHDASNLPDLTIDGSNISISDMNPTEGVTLFFDVPVINRGQTPINNIHIGLYDEDPEKGGKLLFNYVSNADHTIPHLRPGETCRVRLRWDPVKNSGRRKVFVKVDSSDRISETDESNNTAVVSLYVRTKADLRPTGIDIMQTPEEKEQLIAHLAASVENRGETEARNVSVRFFKGKVQTPETMIGETTIPKIDPGETVQTDHIWELTEEEARFTYRPTYQVFLKGSSQRLSSVDEEERVDPPRSP